MDQTPLHAFIAELSGSERFQAFTKSLPGRARVSEPALPLVLAALHQELGRGVLVLLPEDADARDAAEGASWFLGTDAVALLPSRGVSHASGLEPPPHLVGERARALDVLARGGLVCASAAALAEGMPPHAVRPQPIGLVVGGEPGLEGLSEALASAGYERVDRVDQRGQFAVRGGIVDVFPSTGREPLRVEFFGDEIEQVRAFSPFTQRALHPVAEASIYPAAERRVETVDIESAAHLWEKSERGENVAQASTDHVAPVDRAPDFVWQPDEVKALWEEEGLEPVSLEGATELDPFPRGQAFQFEAQRPAIAARGLAEAENELAGFVRSDNRVVVVFPHRGEALRQGGLLRKVESTMHADGAALPREACVRFAVSAARRGFVWRDLRLVLLPDTQVFRKRPPRADARLGRALATFADLRVGDYVVHEDHGVGKLLGFETKEVAGVTRDYLFLAFRGDDRLYVPHEQLGKLSRYIGADAKSPALSKLGGKAWQNLKSRARESVRELAGELLALYAQRQRAEGASFDLNNEWLERLEASFPYRETDDQARAIEAVKEDLESTRPMDRLVCGDVGFGKTEVAVRAAFAVAVNNRQVLVLCPTTILAEQHWNTFRDRFRDFPLNVEMVSRFRKPAETKKVIADFAAGKVDVLVGTHRILSRDVIPSALGLVILDEEQRFGVAQKELIRSLRLEVDVLALSATPIPRTLHMSLSGLRDISIIETPPEGRRPIRTTVGEYDESVIKTALEREHARGGQSFYLHNRVDTIDEMGEKLRQLCPALRFLVAHGQMRENELEERMHAFLAGDADVLVSTTIIESGIDIPQANTLIVERADTLGLSQLYQIRGRVGRSDVTAHAYLFYPDADGVDARSPRAPGDACRPHRTRRRVSRSRCAISRFGAPAICSAPSSPGMSQPWGSSCTSRCSTKPSRSSLARLGRPFALSASMHASTRTYPPPTSPPRHSRSTSIDGLPSSSTTMSSASCGRASRIGTDRCRSRSTTSSRSRRRSSRSCGSVPTTSSSAAVAPRSGRSRSAPTELRALRAAGDTIVYTQAKHEVSLRTDDLKGALGLADAIVAARSAA